MGGDVLRVVGWQRVNERGKRRSRKPGVVLAIVIFRKIAIEGLASIGDPSVIVAPIGVPSKSGEATLETLVPKPFVKCLREAAGCCRRHSPTVNKDDYMSFLIGIGDKRGLFPLLLSRAVVSLIELLDIV